MGNLREGSVGADEVMEEYGECKESKVALLLEKVWGE